MYTTSMGETVKEAREKSTVKKAQEIEKAPEPEINTNQISNTKVLLI